MQATVAAAKAQFRNPIVEWKRILPQEGKTVKIEATLRDRKHNRKHNGAWDTGQMENKCERMLSDQMRSQYLVVNIPHVSDFLSTHRHATSSD